MYFVGILATSGVEGSGFIRAKNQPANESYPYLQFNFLPTLVGSPSTADRATSVRRKINLIPKVHHIIEMKLYIYVCI